jgi:hypothetical protein
MKAFTNGTCKRICLSPLVLSAGHSLLKSCLSFPLHFFAKNSHGMGYRLWHIKAQLWVCQPWVRPVAKLLAQEFLH